MRNVLRTFEPKNGITLWGNFASKAYEIESLLMNDFNLNYGIEPDGDIRTIPDLCLVYEKGNRGIWRVELSLASWENAKKDYSLQVFEKEFQKSSKKINYHEHAEIMNQLKNSKQNKKDRLNFSYWDTNDYDPKTDTLAKAAKASYLLVEDYVESVTTQSGIRKLFVPWRKGVEYRSIYSEKMKNKVDLFSIRNVPLL